MCSFGVRCPVTAGCLILCLIAIVTFARADVPVFGDSFRNTAPDHAPGSPVHGAKLERGHGRWEATAGLYFDNGNVKGGGSAEYGRFRFDPSQHRQSARVYIDSVIDPGSNGWSGVGFTNGEDGPLPSVGQLWMKIDDRGRIEVRADGASNKLYKDSHTHPAYVPGENRVRIEYNRRLNTARAWLNDTELPLGELGKNGFVPEIRAVAFQLKKNGAGLKTTAIGDGLNGGIWTSLDGAVVGDFFKVEPQGEDGNHEGDPLDGVPTGFGFETWVATPSVGIGPGYATNIGLGPSVSMVPFALDDFPGYEAGSIEAIINPGTADWAGIGFMNTSSGSLALDGEVWVRLMPSGVVEVLVDGTSETLFDEQVLDPGTVSAGIPIKLTYNRLTGAVQVDIGELELEIPSVNVNVPAGSFPLDINAGGFQAKRTGGFTEIHEFAVDSFMIRVSEEIRPLAISEHPTSVQEVFGLHTLLSCDAEDGVPPYSFQWEYAQLIGVPPNDDDWVEIGPGTLAVSGADSPVLAVSPVSIDHRGFYRCVVTDSNSIPSQVPSSTAELFVLEPIAADTFSTGGATGRIQSMPLDDLALEYGDEAWSANGGAVLGADTLTNQPTADHVLAEVSISQLMIDTFDVLSTSANVLVGESDWIGVGFSTDDLANFPDAGSGQLWIRLGKSGRVKVFGNGALIFDQTLLSAEDLEEPVHLRVDYDIATETPGAWVNDQELFLAATGPLGPFGATGIDVRKGGGFSSPGMFEIDDFAFTGSVETAAPEFTQTPESQSVCQGADATLSCAVTGGLPPYAFQWYRSGEIIASDDAYTVETDDADSILTLNSYEPSLEGAYTCFVVDSRYGEPSPAQVEATITSDLPSFKVLWKRSPGLPVFVANAFKNGERVNWLRAGDTYDIGVVIGGGNKVEPNISFPITIYADCHAPGHEYGPPYLPVGSVMVPGGSSHVDVPIRVDGGCLGDSDWGILSLIADVNAVDDPSDPLGYPSRLEDGMPYLAENGFGTGNRAVLQSWIPVAKTGFGDFADAVGSESLEFEFDDSGGLSVPSKYPTEWTMADQQANYYGDALLLHLQPWQPCPYLSDAIPSNYKPYVAWNTAKNWAQDPVGAMTRHRVAGANAGSGDDFIYFGVKQGMPPSPSVEITVAENGTPLDENDLTDAAVLGQGEASADSKNLLSWVYNRQYHVLVWNGSADSLAVDPGDTNPTDGVALMEIPEFPDGTEPSGTQWWMYLGFNPDALQTWGDGVACDITKTEWYYIDSIRLWGNADPTDPVVFDYEAGAILLDEYGDGTSEFPMPTEVEDGAQLRPCVEVQALPGNLSPPGTVYVKFGTRCGDADQDDYSNPYSTELVESSESGRSVHCLLDETATPVNTHTFWDVSMTACPEPNDGHIRVNVIKACLEESIETPGYQENNCATHGFEELQMGCPVPAVDLP